MPEEIRKPSSSSRSSYVPVVGERVPPSAVEIERALLGALMLEHDLAIDLNEFLHPEHFYDPRHRNIYEAIVALVRANRPVDLLTVRQQLADEGTLQLVGGPPYLAELTAIVASAAHAEAHARIVVQKYLQRELIRIASDVQGKGYDGTADVYDLIEEAEQQIFELHEFGGRKESQSIEEVVREALDAVHEAEARPDGLSGISSGFDNLDALTQGWQRGDLIIIAARPSMGKTAFVLTMARNMAVKHDASIAFFSLEMPNAKLLMRLLVAESGLDSKMVQAGKLNSDEWFKLNEAADRLSRTKIFLDDTQSLGVGELRSKARRLKAKYGIDLIVVDYLQLMQAPVGRNGNREQEVSKISSSLKALAKEIDVPVVALSQLSRAIESRSDTFKRPMLSDLRESGAIEQDADIVAFIHRPERFRIEEYPDGTPTKGMAELVVLKNRNGETDTLYFQFVPHLTQFKDVGDRTDHYSKTPDVDASYQADAKISSRINVAGPQVPVGSIDSANPFGTGTDPFGNVGDNFEF